MRLREEYLAKYPDRAQLRVHRFLLMNRTGHINKEALTSAMSRLKASMTDDGLAHVYWTPHDLKRKGISDAESTEIAGHKTYEMQQRYNTKIVTIQLKLFSFH